MSESILPDFMAKLKQDLDTFDRDAVHRLGRWEKSLQEATTKGDHVRAQSCRHKIEYLGKTIKIEREHILKDWETWKASIMKRQDDLDFLMGRGLMASALMSQVETYKDINPEFEKSHHTIVGYVEIHQWHSEDIVDGVTTFSEVLDRKITSIWWRKQPEVFATIASEGHRLYAIKLGGTLHFIHHTPGTCG